MKPLYSPTEVQFRVMKEEPEITPDGTIRFPWATFSPNGDVHTWDNHDVGGENWNANDYPDENKYLQALARTPYKNPAPYRPGEKCYVREQYANLKALREQAKRLIEQWPYGSYEMPSNIDDGPDVIYKSDWDAQGKKFVGKWIFTTAESARRFVTVLSCEPVRVSEICVADLQELGYFASLMQDPCDMADQIKDKFKADWRKRHPDKEWAWRIEISEGREGCKSK